MASAVLALTSAEGSLRSNVSAVRKRDTCTCQLEEGHPPSDTACLVKWVPSHTCSFEIIPDFSTGKLPSIYPVHMEYEQSNSYVHTYILPPSDVCTYTHVVAIDVCTAAHKVADTQLCLMLHWSILTYKQGCIGFHL